jgi:hypothetical protein
VLPYNAPNLTAVTWSRPVVGKGASSSDAGWTSLALRRQGPGFAGGGLTDGQINDMFTSLNLLDADMVEPLGAAPAGAPAFRIQTDGGEGAQFNVLVYRRSGGGWLASNPTLGLLYRLPANAFDSFPGPVTAFLGIAKAAPATSAPPHNPGAVTPTSGGAASPTPATPGPPGGPAPAKQPTP